MHVFSANEEKQENTQSSFSIMSEMVGNMVPASLKPGFLDAKWSFSKLNDTEGGCKTAIIGEKIYAFSLDGILYKGVIGTDPIKL